MARRKRRMSQAAKSARDDKSVTLSPGETNSSNLDSDLQEPNVIPSFNWAESFFDAADYGASGYVFGSSLLPESSICPQQEQIMAPPHRSLLPKDRFALAFGGLKTQSYHDPSSRAPGSHT